MEFNPEQDLRIEEDFVAPIKPSGPKRTATSKAIKDWAIFLIEINWNSREKSAEVFAYQSDGISQASVLKMLKRRSYCKQKPTRKLLLNEDQKQARLEFVLHH